MSADGFVLFDTAIGRCGIAWRARGISGVQLPEADDQETHNRLAKRFPEAHEIAPPTEVQSAIDGIAALLRGEVDDLSTVQLDLSGVPPFRRRVYEIARAIRLGSTLTYGEVAAQIGSPGSARAVGQALGRNPFPLIVPCHRVVAAGGKPGGFSAYGGRATKEKLLAIEGITPLPTLNF